jgi:death-on-curing protein
MGRTTEEISPVSEREPWVGLITADGVRELHAAGIQKFGGDFSAPQEGCLERSLGAAWSLEVYGSPDGALPCLSFCAGLLYYLVMNHCFTDGNKRTAWTSAMEAIRTLGLTVRASDDEAEKFCLDIISGTVKRATDVVPWLAKRLEEFPVV